MHCPLDERPGFLRCTGQPAGDTDNNIVAIPDLEHFCLEIVEQFLARPFEAGRQSSIRAGETDENPVTWQIDVECFRVAAVCPHRNKRHFSMNVYRRYRIRQSTGSDEAQQNSENKSLNQSTHPLISSKRLFNAAPQ